MTKQIPEYPMWIADEQSSLKQFLFSVSQKLLNPESKKLNWTFQNQEKTNDKSRKRKLYTLRRWKSKKKKEMLGRSRHVYTRSEIRCD